MANFSQNGSPINQREGGEEQQDAVPKPEKDENFPKKSLEIFEIRSGLNSLKMLITSTHCTEYFWMLATWRTCGNFISCVLKLNF